MRETEFTEIDGEKYVCTMMPGTKAQMTFVEMSQLIGAPAMAMIAKAFEPVVTKDGDVKEGLDAHTVESLMAQGVQVFLTELTPAQSDRIIKTLMDGIKCEGVGDLSDVKLFDAQFRGRVLTMYRVFSWSMEVNFRDFFDAALSSRIRQILQKAGAKAWSGLTSIPSSEDSSSDQGETST